MQEVNAREGKAAKGANYVAAVIWLTVKVNANEQETNSDSLHGGPSKGRAITTNNN